MAKNSDGGNKVLRRNSHVEPDGLTTTAAPTDILIIVFDMIIRCFEIFSHNFEANYHLFRTTKTCTKHFATQTKIDKQEK